MFQELDLPSHVSEASTPLKTANTMNRPHKKLLSHRYELQDARSLGNACEWLPRTLLKVYTNLL